MGDLNEFPATTRLFLRGYPWRRISPVPWTPVRKPLSECRLALVSSAGFTTPDQADFDPTVRGGDPSFRRVPSAVEAAQLRSSHRSQSFNHAPMESDPNIAFPVDRVRELVAEGVVASASRHHLSFMGSITAPGRLVRHTAPEAAGWLVAEEVDVALLVPV